MERSPLLAAGAINAAIAVAAGAFATHGLKERLEQKALEVFETAARYQMYHALAMVLCALLVARTASLAGVSRLADSRRHPALAIGWVFQGGIVLFSGSLYVLALTDTKWLGAITPFGGLGFLAGWALLAWRGLRG